MYNAKAKVCLQFFQWLQICIGCWWCVTERQHAINSSKSQRCNLYCYIDNSSQLVDIVKMYRPTLQGIESFQRALSACTEQCRVPLCIVDISSANSHHQQTLLSGSSMTIGLRAAAGKVCSIMFQYFRLRIDVRNPAEARLVEVHLTKGRFLPLEWTMWCVMSSDHNYSLASRMPGALLNYWTHA